MNHGTRRHGRTVRRPVEPRRSTRRVPPPAEARREPRARRPKGLIWNGTISFGLVNIPVTLHSGENTKEKIVKGFRLEDDRRRSS